MEELNIFLSSPGDVKEERQLVKKLAERITKRSNNRIKLNAYAWEDDQLFLATEGGYQTNIVRTSDPADFDLLICILWSRLGTPLNPHDFNQAQYMSGTEYEYLRATQAYKERKARGEFPVKPDVLIFRRTDKVRAPELDPDDPASMERFKEFSRQIEAVNTFFRTHIEPDYNNAAYHRYSLSNKAGPGSERNDFADKIEHCLIEWIKTKFKERGEDPEMAMRLKSWHESPFRALEVFEEEHQAIYFGRDNVQQRVMDQFKSQYEHGSPFVLIYGASGSGKSSLLRAGLFPKFRGGGLVDGVSSWNIALFVPSKALTPEGKETGADLIRALAESLFSAVPELKNKTTPDMLAAELRTSPSAAVAALGAALETQRDAGREKRNVKSLEPIRVFLGLDQVEEFFTIPSLAGSEIHAFFAALAELVRSQLVGVIGTMRSDFYHRCDKVPALAEMTAGLGSYRLVAPSHAEIGDMIRKPAELAGLRFESDPEKGKLDEVILHEAVKNPEALPLLEYALQLLYEEGHADGLLSHANYQKIGGVEKAIATQAHTTFENLKATSEKEKWNLDDAFDTVFRQLIFLNESSKGTGKLPPNGPC